MTHGTTKVPFPFGVYLDGEAVETGRRIGSVLSRARWHPVASKRLEEIRQQNQAAGTKGKTRMVGGAMRRSTLRRASSATRPS